jgi:hypothetical protein
MRRCQSSSGYEGVTDVQLNSKGRKRLKAYRTSNAKRGSPSLAAPPPAMEGKWIHDGLGNRIAWVAEENAIRPEDGSWKPGVRDFAMFIASKMLKPQSADNFRQGRWGPTHYVHAFYPDSAFALTTPPVKTWKGSDSAHFFKGQYNGLDNDVLARRKRLCSCNPCLESTFPCPAYNKNSRSLTPTSLCRQTPALP